MPRMKKSHLRVPCTHTQSFFFFFFQKLRKKKKQKREGQTVMTTKKKKALDPPPPLFSELHHLALSLSLPPFPSLEYALAAFVSWATSASAF